MSGGLSRRVLLATPDFPPETGGIQLLLHRLVRYSRHQYRVVTLAQLTRSEASLDGIDVVRTRRFGDHRAAVAALNIQVFRQVTSWRPQALVCGHVVVAPSALSAQRCLGVPAIQYLYSDELRGRRRVAAAAVRRSSRSIAISAHTRAQVLDLGGDPNRVRLIAPGVDLPTGPVPAPRDRNELRPTILTVARMEDRYKGFDMILRALPLIQQRVEGVRWVVVGDGPLRRPLEATARAWGLSSSCLFLGRVTDEERDSWLSRAQVFALPSRIASEHGGSEGFGIVFLEAAAHYLPCVAGRGSGGADAVDDGRTGILVDPYDHVALAEALASLLSDPGRREQMGLAARRRAEQFTWARMAAAVDDVVDEVTS